MRMYPDMNVTGASGVGQVPPKDDSTKPEVSKSQMAPLFNFSEQADEAKTLSMSPKDVPAYAKMNNCSPREAVKMLKSLGVDVKQEVMTPDQVEKWASDHGYQVHEARAYLTNCGFICEIRQPIKDGELPPEEMMARADEKYGNRLQNYVPEPQWKELPTPAIDIPGGMKGNMVRALMQWVEENKSGK